MLAGALFFYAASSQVVWLLLIAYWVAGLTVASFFYALWNRGVILELRLVGIRRSSGMARDQLAERVTREEAFEGDSLRVEFAMFNERGARGPVRVSGKVGPFALSMAAGLIPKKGWSETKVLGPLRRGPATATDWTMELGDPLGLFRTRAARADKELSLALPWFASLRTQSQALELEAAVTAPRAGSGTEVFGVREYRPGDALRRIHWRSSARRGELVVREFEPPGVQSLGIFCDPSPPSLEAADQIARIAASEAWDCLRAGGRVTLWAPGCEASRPDEERNMVALLEWLARYPLHAESVKPGPKTKQPHPEGGALKWLERRTVPSAFQPFIGASAQSTQPPPLVGDAVVMTTTSEPQLLDALEMVRSRGGSVRAWVVGEAVLALDVPVERAGLGWPL